MRQLLVVRSAMTALAIMLTACGGDPGTDGTPDAADADAAAGDGGATSSDGSSPEADAGSDPSNDDLSTAEGCLGIYNPDQVLDYYLELPDSNWNALKSDSTNSNYFTAEFSCADEGAITVGVRRKRSGGTEKPGLKVDINEIVGGQRYKGLKKLSLENGVSSGDTEDNAEVGNIVSEYLGWRLMVLSGAVSGRSALARVHVNGELIGVYANVEHVDKTFLESRFGDDSGWLYKKSGGDGDGQKTHESDGLENPYDDYFCFWASGNDACERPSDQELADTLPEHLDIDQMLVHGAVNAIMANTDGLVFKDNNYYYYDWAGGRAYLPWDLDTTMRDSPSVFSGGGGGTTTEFVDILYSNWEDDYDAVLTELLAGPLTLEAIQAELDRVASAAGTSFADDPYVSGSLDGALDDLDSYWTNRHAEVQAEVDAH